MTLSATVRSTLEPSHPFEIPPPSPGPAWPPMIVTPAMVVVPLVLNTCDPPWALIVSCEAPGPSRSTSWSTTAPTAKLIVPWTEKLITPPGGEAAIASRRLMVPSVMLPSDWSTRVLTVIAGSQRFSSGSSAGRQRGLRTVRTVRWADNLVSQDRVVMVGLRSGDGYATRPIPISGGHDHYHLSEDLADDAINYLRRHKAFEPDKPFLMYWASGAGHGPHHVPKEWADKYKGKFDDGWDKYRERAFHRAKEKGWIPATAVNTPRPATLASWDSIPENEKPFQRRLMEVYAGFCEHVDHQVGRLVDEVESLGYGDNTLVLYIWGDNGASAEGQNGTISELLAQNGIPSTIEQHIKALDSLGGLAVLGSPKTDPMYHAGWAWAGGAPYQGTKLLASHFGGTRNPMAVRWPARIKPDSTPRPQFHHVSDIARPSTKSLASPRHAWSTASPRTRSTA